MNKMTPVQLSSKSLAELQKILRKALSEKDEKIAAFAQAAIEEIQRRMKEKK